MKPLYLVRCCQFLAPVSTVHKHHSLTQHFLRLCVPVSASASLNSRLCSQLFCAEISLRMSACSRLRNSFHTRFYQSFVTSYECVVSCLPQSYQSPWQETGAKIVELQIDRTRRAAVDDMRPPFGSFVEKKCVFNNNKFNFEY